MACELLARTRSGLEGQRNEILGKLREEFRSCAIVAPGGEGGVGVCVPTTATLGRRFRGLDTQNADTRYTLEN